MLAGAVLALGGTAVPASSSDARPAEEVLARAVEASADTPHRGTVTVVAFTPQGPTIDELELTRGARGVLVTPTGGTAFGRVEGHGFLHSSSRLLRVGGVEPLPVQLDRLHDKYEARLGDPAVVDTGPAAVVELFDRDLGILRERLYGDRASGLVVRRETFDSGGGPRRVVAFTRLELAERTVSLPDGDGLDVREHAASVAEVEHLASEGFTVPERLGRGFELVAAVRVPDAPGPTLHLVYGDGLYTLSVFEQQGRLDGDAVDGATRVESGSGVRYRWPGAQPARLVWSGEGATFTALSDAPPDELLAAVAPLPAEAPAGLNERLARGLARLGRWLVP